VVPILTSNPAPCARRWLTVGTLSRQRGSPAAGFSLVELLIVMAIIGVLGSMGMALYGNARIRGHEANVVASLGTINQAQFAFAQSCGNQRFSSTLAGLSTPMPSTGNGFISPDLAVDPVIKSGYTIVLQSTADEEPIQSCNGITTVPAYSVSADPVNPGYTGLRYFGTNTERVIFEDQAATFSGNMPERGAPPHGSELK
jgi:prepilin-type N-terminal cleavage/methylation domain-containing protein